MSGWSRCNFDGKPMHPDDAAKIRDFGALLQARAAGDRDLQWLERVDDEGPHWRAWYCPLPPLRKAYQITDGEWTGPGVDGLWTLRIYAIALAPIA